MKNTMEYKGYLGSVEFDEEEGLLFGRVMGIRSLISYEGESAKELLEDFHGAVDDYLELCRAELHVLLVFAGKRLVLIIPDQYPCPPTAAGKLIYNHFLTSVSIPRSDL